MGLSFPDLCEKILETAHLANCYGTAKVESAAFSPPLPPLPLMKRGKERRLGKDGPVKNERNTGISGRPSCSPVFPPCGERAPCLLGCLWTLLVPDPSSGSSYWEIRIIGATYVTREEVLEEGGLWEPINVLDIDRKQLIQNLEKDVRIEKASISFAFPTYFDIHITERLPGLYVECDGPQFAKVSYSGHVLAVHSSIPDATAPLLTGYHGGNLMEGDEIEDEDVRGLLQFFGPLGTFHSGPDYGSFHGWAEADHYPSAPELPIIVGDAENANKKIDTFVMLCREMGNRKFKGKYIDITYEQPYVKLE